MNQIDDLADMISYCESIDRHNEAGILRRYLNFLETTERLIAMEHYRLGELLKAIEWQSSGDYGPDAIDEAFKKLKPR